MSREWLGGAADPAESRACSSATASHSRARRAKAELELAPVVLPADPDARVAPAACARLEAAYFSGDVLPDGARAFFAAALGAPKLRWLQIFNAGVDHPVFARFLERGVRLTTASGSRRGADRADGARGAAHARARLPALAGRAAPRAPGSRTRRPRSRATCAARRSSCSGSARSAARSRGMARALGLRVIGVRRGAARGRRAGRRAPPARPAARAPAARGLARDRLPAQRRDAQRDRRGRARAAAARRARCSTSRAARSSTSAALVAALARRPARGRLSRRVRDRAAARRTRRSGRCPTSSCTPHNSAASRGNEARQVEIFLDNLARYGARRAAAQRSPRVKALAVVLTVLSYNVHGLDAWLVDDDPEARLPQISERLDKYDVALIQEIWSYYDLLAARATHPVRERGNGPDPGALFQTGLATFARPPLLAVSRGSLGACSGWLGGANDCSRRQGLPAAAAAARERRRARLLEPAPGRRRGRRRPRRAREAARPLWWSACARCRATARS